MDGTIEKMLDEVIRSRMLELHTMLPGTVVEFDEEKQTVDVQINLKRDYNGEKESIAVLKDVPIRYPRAGGYLITFPIKPGDECSLEFMERSIDNWLLDGGEVDPADSRHHSLSDAVAYVGTWNRTNPIKKYNTKEPEFRTEDGIKKVWLSDDGWVEMVNLDLDTRVVLMDNGDVRVANDKVKTMVEVFEDTRIKIHNPLAKTRISAKGNILNKNLLTSREMDEFGDITDKTILAKQELLKTGKKLFKNAIAKQIVEASGQIKFNSLLNKFDMAPSGITKLGNAINRLKIDPVQSTLGGALSKLKINPSLSSLGNPLASLKVLPTNVLLKDAGGVVTPSIVSALASAVSEIAGSLGLDSIVSAIASEVAKIDDLLELIPDEEEDVIDPLETVHATIKALLIEHEVDLESETAISLLNLSDRLDSSWDDKVFDDLMAELFGELNV